MVVIQNFGDGWVLQELSYKITAWMRFTMQNQNKGRNLRSIELAQAVT
jgi:hypothetical protein